MESKAELRDTSQSDIFENFKDLSVEREKASGEKTAVSDLKIDAETIKDGASSSKVSQKATVRDVVYPSNRAKVQPDQTTIEATMKAPIEDLLQRQLEFQEQFTLARNKKTLLPTTAEILKDNVCFLDLIPTDPLVRQHFGYSKVNSVEEETCLQGLYKGLFLVSRPPTSVQIQEWVRQDKLAEGIEKYYLGYRSGYFNWFKKNKHVLSQRYERVDGPWSPAETYFALDSKKLNELTKSDTESEEKYFDDDDDDD